MGGFVGGTLWEELFSPDGVVAKDRRGAAHGYAGGG